MAKTKNGEMINSAKGVLTKKKSKENLEWMTDKILHVMANRRIAKVTKELLL